MAAKRDPDEIGNNISANGKIEAGKGMPDYVTIFLEENPLIPPVGQFFGINGVGYMLKAGVEAKVPRGIVDILDNAVESVATTDPVTMKVTGYISRRRFPYRIVQQAA